MTDERVRAKEAREIDLVDLILDVLLHWRGLIISMLIGGLLLGGYSVYSSVKVNKAAKIAASAAEEEKAKVLSDQEYYEQEMGKIEKRIADLEDSLTAKDKGDAKLVLAYREQLKIQQEYMDNSVLMKVDAYNVPTGSVTLRLITDQANASVLRDTYKGMLSSTEMYGVIKDKLGYGSEIAELIALKEANTNAGVSGENMYEDGNEGILVYGFKALTEDECEALENAFIEYAKVKSSEYKKTIGDHELLVVDASVSTVFDSEIATKQNTVIQTIGALESNLAKGYEALSAGGKEYYDLMCKREDMESEIVENIERAEIASVVIPPITVGKKKLLIGLAGGFFVYVILICLAYIFSQKIKDSDDFGTTFGVNQLGKIYRESKSAKFATKLDKAIYSLKRRGRKKVSFGEASSIVAVNTALIASKGGYKKIGLITVDKNDALTGKISEALKSERVEGVVLSEPLYSGQDMSALKSVDAAVIVAKSGISRYDELWDVIEVLDNQKVEILGGIMA